MIRRSFLKFAATAVLVPALNWTLPHFANDRFSIVELFRRQQEAMFEEMVRWHENYFWGPPPVHTTFGINYWVEQPKVERKVAWRHQNCRFSVKIPH